MNITTNKSRLILLLVTASVLPKQLCGEKVLAAELGNSVNASKPEALANHLPDNVESTSNLAVPISEPESLSSPPEFESNSPSEISNSAQQLKLADLEQQTSNSHRCIPPQLGTPEFTQIETLEPKLSNSEFCQPHKLEQIQKQQQTPTSDSPTKSPTVIELLQKPVLEKPPASKPADSNYIIPPRVIAKEKVPAFTTTMLLNGSPISHLTEWEFTGGSSFSNQQNQTFDVNGIIKLNSQIEASLTKNNIFTVEQKGSYLQLQTVRTSREVTVAKKNAETIMGTEIQLSLTANCLSNSDQQCTYTPGIITDKNAIDPETLMPTRINQTSKFGDVVETASLDAMKQPGFQTGANGQEIGVDLYFPNVGTVSSSDIISATRKEQIENTPLGMYSTVRQVVRANDKEAVIGRTVRGFGLIANDENRLLNSAVQLGNLLLPDANPQIAGGTNPPNKNVNYNLFFAANNARLPANSFTFYHAGIGEAKSTSPEVTDQQKLPSAKFNSIWIGLSPITKRSLSEDTYYEVTGPQRTIVDAGAEGGYESNVNFISLFNHQSISTANLQNFYTQIYLKMFLQDVNALRTSKFTEETSYFPHLSFTGNTTKGEDVFRYYAGVIGAQEIKAYLGTDFTKNTPSGLNYSLGGIAYLNPDYDYYSKVIGSVSQKISLSQNANLFLSTGLNYALDQPSRIGNAVMDLSGSSLTVGARANLGDFSVGLINYFGDIMPNSVKNTLVADIAANLGDNLQLSAYYTPINENSARSQYGASAQFKLGKKYNSPTLTFLWANNEYDLGADSSGQESSVKDNVFQVWLRLGEPNNPFIQ
ncbi:MAG: hypothetical protein RMX68_004910 [Aulosira sp. ZfuVER01]|nr:hypothetical protein [Aulosira sp. ZfuVER01]MDZ8000706.1 hypothetical protein [Aulosira sp. DedVER01a]MDZ8051821.1 hypothetical protein [Aulosira sp. ZfuCHP01]